MKYTVNTVTGTEATLFSLDGSQFKTIVKSHKHYNKMKFAHKEQLIVNFNESGRVTTTKTGATEAYKKQTPQAKATPKKPFDFKNAVTSMQKLDINTDLLVPVKTNTVFDKFMSTEEGFLPGTNIMAAGAPGVGKTTMLLELLSGAQQNGHKVLFISAEMNKMDMARYLKRFPHWKTLPILFLNEFTEDCPQTIVEGVINEGWDLILTDSYTEVNDTVKESCNLTRSKTEKWFLDLMIANNEGKNKTKTFTTFVTILQLSKGGVFVGSNKLKHMTSAMMDINWDGAENSGARYMEFTKNRCGQVGSKLYYSLGETCKFDEDRYIKEQEYTQLLNKEETTQDFSWDDIFQNNEEAIQKADTSEI